MTVGGHRDILFKTGNISKDDCMTTMITARIDSQKRKTAEKVFSEVGLTTSAAVNLFICAVAMHGGIPFQIGVKPVTASGHEADSQPERHGGRIKIGIADGKYAFKPDFDKKFDEMNAEVAEMFG